MERKSILYVGTDTELGLRIKDLALSLDETCLIVEARNGKDAMKKFSFQEFTLLICDLELPNGSHLIKALENPYHKFSRPKFYLFFAKSLEKKEGLIPRVNRKTLMELPLKDEELKKIIHTAFVGRKKRVEKKEHLKIPIEIVIKFGKSFPFSIFIKLADKIIKLSHGDEERQEQFQKYSDKGMMFVYVVKNDYISYLNGLKDNMAAKFGDPDTIAPTQDLVGVLDVAHRSIKSVFEEGFIPPESIDLAKVVASNSLKMIEKTPNIFQFFGEFKEKCSQQFMLSMITGYLTSCMVETFDWQTSAIKEKLTLACLLCDITLENEDFIEMKEKDDNPKELSPKVLNHPAKVVELLTPNIESLSKEILTIIIEHHEKPDGTGYPAGTKHLQINVLSAIFIVAYDFVEVFIDLKFDNKVIPKIMIGLGAKYNMGCFKKAYKALESVFNSK